VVFFFGILTYLIITRETQLVRDIYHEESSNASRLVVEHLRELMFDNRPEGITKYIEDINKDTRMQVGIFGQDGRPAFGTNIQAPARGDAGHEETFVRTGDSLIFYRPLQNNEQCRRCHDAGHPVIGTVVIKHSVLKMEEAVRGTARRIILFALFLGLTSEIFLIIIVRRMILGPIEKLGRGAKILMGGRLDYRMDLTSDDEIGSLSSCFNDMADSIERSRSNLETAINQKTKELRVIAELSTGVFAGNMGLEEIIEKSLTTITCDMGFRYATLCLIERETGFLAQEYNMGLSTDICSIETSLASRHPLMTLIREARIAIRDAADINVPDEFGKVVIIPLLSQQRKSCRETNRCAFKDCPAFNSTDYRCWLVQGTLCRSPIAVAGPDKIYGCLHCEAFPVIGVLLVGRDEEITKTSVHSLEILASGITSAIENRRFIEGKKEDISNLVRLHDTSVDVLQSLDLGGLTESVVSSAIAFAKMDAAVLWLKGTEGSLHFERAAGLEGSRVPHSIPVDDTFVGRAVLERQIVETVKISEVTCLSDILQQHAFLYAASIPLMHEGELSGCLTLFKKRDFLMTDSERAIIQLFSSQVSAAINTARLYRSLGESEKRYKELIETAEDTIFTLTPEGILTSLNHAFESMTGYAPEEWLGKHFAPLINPADLALAMTMLHRVIQGQVPPLFELRLLSKSSGYQVVEFKVVPQHYEDRVTGIMGIGRNITSRKKMEQALLESEEKFRALAYTATDAIVGIDNRGIITYWNPAAERIFGYGYEEAAGRELHMLIAPPDYREAFRRGFRQFTETGEGKAIGNIIEFTALRKDGSAFPIEVSVSAFQRNAEWQAVGIIRDITDRKRTEEELSRLIADLNSEKDFSDAIFNNMIMGVMVLDKNGRIVRLNRAGQDILRVDPQEVTGECLSAVLPQLSDFLILSHDLSREVSLRRGEHIVPIGFTNSPLLDPEGSPIATITVFRDLSEIKKLQSEIRKKEHFESMGKVLSGVAHEVRNPLFGISSIAQILEREIVSDQHQSLIKALLKEADRMKNLIDELLLYSRPARLNIRDIDLGILMEEIKYSLHGKRDEIGIEVQIPALFIIKADAEKISQVFLNLLNNALAAAVNTVKISAHVSPDGSAEITTRDDGPGIPAEHLDKIFDPFFTTKKGGTGLGLPICKKIVEDHGGTINVTSELGQGTEVMVTLRG